jgi:hypothetical protein
METMKRIWCMPFLTIDGDTFTVGQCVLTWSGIVCGLIILGLAGGME